MNKKNDNNEQEKLIEDMFERGFLINKELLVQKVDMEIARKIEFEQDILVLNSDYAAAINQQTSLIDWYELDRHRVDVEKERNEELYQTELQKCRVSPLVIISPEGSITQNIRSLEMELDGRGRSFDTGESASSSSSFSPSPSLQLSSITTLEANVAEELLIPQTVSIVFTFDNKPHKYTTKDFTSIFLSRYRFLEKILRSRQELQNTLAIDRVLQKTEKEQVSIIGIVQDIGVTKNGNLIIKIEDMGGIISVLFSKNKPDLFQAASDLVLDEVVGISGSCQKDIIFAENIVWPDIVESQELKKSPVEEYALFLSDIHVGSHLFQKKEFEKFLSWLNSETGNEEQRAIAKLVKYIIISGDAVDGVGIYPSQEEELEIKDIHGQYQQFSLLLQKIPSDKQIIICPGNHDAVHLAEPQPAIHPNYCADLFSLPNVTLVSNPAMVNIGKQEHFPGFDVLLYHGYSFDYYVANVDSIRNNGGYHRADLIMKFLLKRRHLAPSFRSTPYFPGYEDDPLLIKKIPDFFVSGHIHYCSVAQYKGVTTICGSCWQGKTTFQEKLGHNPEPARVPIVNLKTRKIKILKFN